ncbi:hypothetical protein HYH11_02155 [Lactobacillus salivarius]|uniref:hypothetical protein n=1 Tax=Ligilactobacillus salivarius TaxID=1624 RepID=UPI0015C5B2F7|nr:hypothetical protein [Ligilactobacillus salivarius]NXZ97134.1 hypothetical protein [Ligilactobacillus salivarius]NYA59380.1 hypothetical protein [Ligilactobacillus salivarius]NYA61282.1 hypothetical protein [Ligilactobacillus salivarius]NYA65234.1 hypothetical protein [Ligilactobacillus salivarius]NYA73207.1 hypothetical protein [Ligilactobacillus salivarius]
MRVHITSLYGMMGVVGVSQRRTAEIGRQLGFNELGIFRYPVESVLCQKGLMPKF